MSCLKFLEHGNLPQGHFLAMSHFNKIAGKWPWQMSFVPTKQVEWSKPSLYIEVYILPCFPTAFSTNLPPSALFLSPKRPRYPKTSSTSVETICFLWQDTKPHAAVDHGIHKPHQAKPPNHGLPTSSSSFRVVRLEDMCQNWCNVSFREDNHFTIVVS